MKKLVLAIVACLSLAACSGSLPASNTTSTGAAGSPPSRNVLHDLHSVGELKGMFNRFDGSPRLVLLLSPT